MRIEDVHIRDPFILMDDDTKYLYGTTDENPWDGPGGGFDCYKVNQDGTVIRSTVFQPTKDFWGKENFWAPEVYKYQNEYLMVASFKGVNRGVQILTSSRPDGSFQPVGNQSITPLNQECLDGTLWEEDGQLYMIYSHEWLQCYDGEIRIAKVSNDFLSLQDTKTLFTASEASWTVENVEGPNRGYVTDGPYIYPISKHRLAMIWSSFSQNGYAIGVAYSENGILGPWVHDDKPLYDSDGGHGMIYSENGKHYLIFHGPNTLGKERVRQFEIEEKNGYLFIKEGK
ncbi:MAG: glycoside hydrolase [Lachnospiraceae bacterium]|jgi:hypothetical protein|nr:glycoside hydrolase [Lachnospiraceae bacterium]